MNLQAGQVLEVDIGLGIKHVGIYTGHSVISCSRRKGGVFEERLEEFSQGKPIKVSNWKSSLNPIFIINKARSMIGQRYSLLDNNCEHFVSSSLGYESTSPQLKTFSVLAIGLFTLLSLKTA